MDEKNSPKVLICSPQEQSIQTNYINIDKTGELPICRMSATRNKTISHIVSKCRKLAKKLYRDTRVCNKQREKIEKCVSLKDKTARLWQMK